MKLSVVLVSMLLIFSITNNQAPSWEKATLVTSILVACVMFLCYSYICDLKRQMKNMINEVIEYPTTVLGSKSQISKLETEANVALLTMILSLIVAGVVSYY